MLKLLITVVVVIVWLKLMLGNVMGAGRTAASMELKLGIPPQVAQRRTTVLVMLWALVLTALAVAALVLIW